MSTPRPEIIFESGIASGNGVSKPAYDQPDPPDEAVENFLTRVQFFRTPYDIAQKILLLNQELGENLIESQLATLAKEEPDAKMIEVSENEISENWLQTIISRVSSILFQEDEASEQRSPSEDELVFLFQKTVSEKIYDRLSLLSLSPHGKKGGTFSLTEELTKGIAEDVGLGLYRHEETRADLRARAEAALLNLAIEFEDWLVGEWKGVYSAGWGEIRARIESTTDADPAGVVVWLNPDAIEHIPDTQVVAPDTRGVAAAAEAI